MLKQKNLPLVLDTVSSFSFHWLPTSVDISAHFLPRPEDQQSKFLLRYELKIDYFLTLGKEEK